MRRLRIRWTVALTTALAVGLFLHLSQWQWNKALAVQEAYERYEQRVQQAPMVLDARLLAPDQVQYLPVKVRGVYEASGQFFVDNQQENDVAGLHVITPLRIEGSATRVLINRGWVPWGASRAQLPTVAVPQGTVEVTGLAFVPSHKKFFGVSDQNLGSTDQLRMRVDLFAYAGQAGFAVQPFIILQNEHDADDTLIRHWTAPENKALMHRGYAVQWILISLALVVGVLYSGWREKKVD